MKNNPNNGEMVFMQRALELAARGRGSVSPNPLVGCVIVHQGKIVGEGWHECYGGPHAEVNALNAVQDRSVLPESTVYVTLEPCSHFGKTPPCADLLIASEIKKVVLAHQDPNPLVAGKGIKKLIDGGVQVITGVLETEARKLNRRFLTWVEKKRPFILLKWAETSDGFMAKADGSSKWISHELSRQLVHRWRTEEDAILVGTKTAQLDNPLLNVRDWTGRDPVRIVIDRNLKLPGSLNLFDGTQKTICYNLKKNEERDMLEYVKLDDRNFLHNVINDLYSKGIQSVIVEGGPQTLQQFIDARLWDETRIFISDKKFGEGITSPVISGKPIAEQKIGTDVLKIIQPQENGKG